MTRDEIGTIQCSLYYSLLVIMAFFMHDIVIHLPNSPNKDAEDLDNGENPGNNNGILIQPVFLYVKNQLH